MGFEIKYTYHPRKDVGYDTEITEEKSVKVGKPFDDTSLEKAAAAIMAQLARRDIWVVDVKVVELVKREVSFKECKDGKGIMLKNKRYSFNESAQMIAEEVIEESPTSLACVPEGLQPHEVMAMRQPQTQNSMDELYSNPNKPVPIQKNVVAPVNVNQNRVLYRVIFDPPIQYVNEVKRMNLKLTQDRDYPVHQIVEHPLGKLELQKIVVTDDAGKPITIEEKYFTTAGMGLGYDKQLNFSGGNGNGRGRARQPKLAFEDELVMDAPDPNAGGSGSLPYPVDDGSIPQDLLHIPDIRAASRR